MFIFLSCFSRFVGPCYYAHEKGKKVPRKNFLPLSPVQISLVSPSFDKISELGKRKILPANEANVRETQTGLDLSIHSRPLACLVGKSAPAPTAVLPLATMLLKSAEEPTAVLPLAMPFPLESLENSAAEPTAVLFPASRLL